MPKHILLRVHVQLSISFLTIEKNFVYLLIVNNASV